jgi:putative tryptophan/tyrosine transport system substrate-binding protein
MMRRREFIVGLGSAVAWPVAARAQQPAMPVIGLLGTQSGDEYKNASVRFLQGLKETGYVVGQNVAVEYRWAENQYDRLPTLVADLIRRRVALIVAAGTPAALAAKAAKAATTIIPVVFVTAADPVAVGLVASFNRPGANVTGSASLEAELEPKRLQLLRELMPNAAVFGVLVDPAIPVTPSIVAELQAAARTLGMQVVVANAGTDSDFQTAFAAFSHQHVRAVLVGSSSLYSRHPEQIAALAAPATQKHNVAVGMWTTQERCPHARSDNNRRKQLITIDQTKITHSTAR